MMLWQKSSPSDTVVYSQTELPPELNNHLSSNSTASRMAQRVRPVKQTEVSACSLFLVLVVLFEVWECAHWHWTLSHCIEVCVQLWEGETLYSLSTSAVATILIGCGTWHLRTLAVDVLCHSSHSCCFLRILWKVLLEAVGNGKLNAVHPPPLQLSKNSSSERPTSSS